jgi:exodeoxyribonuclease V alpha subunit
MVDIDVKYSLLLAMKNSARLILIGDSNQLAPVGAGYIFRDLLESDMFTSVELTKIFRQRGKQYRRQPHA